MNKETLKAWVQNVINNPFDENQLAHALATKELIDRVEELEEKVPLDSDDVSTLIRKSKFSKTINALTAENERLSKQVSDITSMWTEVCAENAKMRACLEYIKKNTYGTESCNSEEENNEILARHFFSHQNKARECLASLECKK